MSDLLKMNVMVMSQKPKFIEMTNEYEITDENGTPVGTVRQEGQIEDAQAPAPGLERRSVPHAQACGA